MPSDDHDHRRQARPVQGRRFEVALPGASLDYIQAGTQKQTYRGLRFPKDPFDIALYMRLIERLKPGSIIEVGTSQGGGALWFSDICKNLALNTRVLTIDLAPPEDHFPGIEYYAGDAYDPAGTFPAELLDTLPRPWLISEDSAHTYDACAAVLDFFASRMQSGDYIVVEDGIVSDLTHERYRQYLDGPNRAVAAFLEANAFTFEIDVELCDLYGHNVTFAPNGWLRRR